VYIAHPQATQSNSCVTKVGEIRSILMADSCYDMSLHNVTAPYARTFSVNSKILEELQHRQARIPEITYLIYYYYLLQIYQ